tara:strand:+ start:142 stop:744 length:603 start_codon:yes stop_codon:yes gene_type:complete
MAASNSLLAMHRLLEVSKNADNPEGDFIEFGGYLSPMFLQIVGVLSEALDAIKNLKSSWFENIENKYNSLTGEDVKLPSARRMKLLSYAKDDSCERVLIKGIRDKIGFHWAHNEITKALESLDGNDTEVSNVVDADEFAFVYYSLAEQLLESAGFPKDENEKEKTVLQIRDVMLEFLHVTSHYLPAYFTLVGCSRESVGN